MAHVLQYLTAASISALALFTGAHGQTARAADRQLDFTVFAAEPIRDLAYRPRSNGEPMVLAFYPTARSPRYSYRGPSLLQLFDIGTGELRAEVNVPPRIHTALLILFALEPTGSGAVNYRIAVVDDDPASHEPGTLRILNFSGLELAGTLDGRPVTLQPGSNGPLRVGGAAALVLRTPFRGRSYQAFADSVPLDRSSRGLLLLFPPYRTGSLEVQSRVLLDGVASLNRARPP